VVFSGVHVLDFFVWDGTKGLRMVVSRYSCRGRISIETVDFTRTLKVAMSNLKRYGYNHSRRI